MAFTPDELAAIGRAVEAARINEGWSKEEAARNAGISSITWKRVEDGLGVQDTKLRAVEAALRWKRGTLARIASDSPPDDDDTDETGPVALSDVPTEELLEEIRRRVVANATAEGRLIMHTRVGPVPFDEPTPENVAIRERLTEQRQALEAGDQAPHRSAQH